MNQPLSWIAAGVRAARSVPSAVRRLITQVRDVVRGASLVLVAGLAGLVALTGCAVDLQGQAEPLPSGALPSAAPAPTTFPTTRETDIYFVKGRTLEAVPESITDHSAVGVMRALGAGPPADRQTDLRTLLLDPLNGAPVLVVAMVTVDGEVVVRHTEAFLEMSAIDQVLLMGQVARSMSEIGLDRVLLTDPMGQSAPVSLPDGRVREGAVTADDYRSLLARS